MSLYEEIQNSLNNPNYDTSLEKTNKIREKTLEKVGIGLTLQEKTERLRNTIDYKEKDLQGYTPVTIAEVSDGDSISVIDENGNMITGRLTNSISPYQDSAELTHPTQEGLIQPTGLVESSRYKQAVQPKQVARLLGKDVENLKDEDYNKVGTWQRDQLIKALSATDKENTKPSEFYEPIMPMQVPNNTKAYMKVTGKDSYGRPLMELVNFNTNENIGEIFATDPKTNANFDYLDTKRNILQSEEETNEYDKEVESIKALMDQEYSDTLVDNLDQDGFVGESIDLAQSSTAQAVGNALEGVTRIINKIANNPQTEYRKYLKSIYSKQYPDNPEKVQELIERDVKSVGGTTPAESIKKFEQSKDKVNGFLNYVGLPDLDKLTDKEYMDNWTGVKKSERKQTLKDTSKAKELIATGEVGNVLKGFWLIAKNIDRHIIDSLGASTTLMVPFIGPGLYSAGKVNKEAKDYYKKTGKQMPIDDMITSFTTAIPIAAVEKLFLGHLGRNVLGKNKSIVKNFVRPTDKIKNSLKNISKEGIKGGGIEGFQEILEGGHEQYFTETRDERDLKEALTNYDTFFGGIVATITGAGMGAGSAASGTVSSFKELNLRRKVDKIEKSITPMATKPDEDAEIEMQATLDSTHEKEIIENSPEELKLSYNEIKELRNNNITSLSFKTLQDASRKLSIIKARLAEKGNVKEISDLQDTEYTEDQKIEDLEKIIYYSSPEAQSIQENKNKYEEIGKNLGLNEKTVNETIRKSMEEVSLESKYGPRGYETYNDILNNLKKKQSSSNLTEKQEEKISTDIAKVESLIQNFGKTQIDKLNQFASGIQALIKDREKGIIEPKETIYYNNEQNKFTFYKNKLEEGNLNSPDNSDYRIIKETINNIEGIINTAKKNSIEIEKELFNSYKKGLDILYDSLNVIKKSKGKNLGTIPDTSVTPELLTTSETQSSTPSTSESTKTNDTDKTVKFEKGSFLQDLADKKSKPNVITKDKKSGKVRYKGIEVQENSNLIRKDKKSTPVMAKQVTDTNGNKTIQVNPDNKLWEKKYNEKAWSKPEIESVTPIPTNTFKTEEDFKEFVIEHEYQHTQIQRNKNESVANYENRINQATLKSLGYNTFETKSQKSKPEAVTPPETKDTTPTKGNTPETTETFNTDETVDSQEDILFDEQEYIDTLQEINDTGRDVEKELEENAKQEEEAVKELEDAYKNKDSNNIKTIQKKLKDITIKRYNTLIKLRKSFLNYVKNKDKTLIKETIDNNDTNIVPHTNDNKQNLKLRHIVKFNKNNATMLSLINVKDLTNEAKKFLSRVRKPKFYDGDVRESPAYGMIYNRNGSVNNNIVTAIGLAVEQFMALSSNLLDPQTDAEIASVLGKDQKELTSTDREFVKSNGVFINYIADVIGTEALNLLGLNYNNNPEEITGTGKAIDTKAIYKKLVADIGNYGIEYMLANNYAVMNNINAKDLSSLLENINIEKNNKNTIKTLKIDPSIELENIQDIKEDYESKIELVTFDKNHNRLLKPYKSRPEYTPNDTVRNTKNIFKVPYRILNVLKQRRDTPFNLNFEAINTALANEEALKKYMGYVDDPDSISALYSDKEGMKGKNRAIERAIQHLKDISKTGIDTWYSDWFLSRNHRLFMDSNTINMLENVDLHRFLVTSKNNIAEVNMNSTISRNGYYSALAQSFGIAINKIPPKKRAEIGKKLSKLNPNTLKKEFEKGTIENYLQEQLPDENIKIESIGHLLMGIESLIELKNRKKGKFTTNLKMEFDSKTNGIAIRLLQLANENMMNRWGEKVGFLKKNQERKYKKDIDKTLAEYVYDKKILDAYETIASKAKVGKKHFKEFLNKQMRDNLSEDIADNINFIWQTIYESMPKVIEEEVTSEMRKLMKDPVMVFQYGSGNKSIKRLISNKLKNQFLRQYLYLKENKTKQEMTQQEKKIVFMFDNYIVNYTELKSKPLHKIKLKNNKKMTLDQMFDLAIGETYGERIVTILKSEFENFVVANEIANVSFRAMMKRFKEEYKYEKNQIMENSENNVFTEKDNIELVKSLLNKFPLIKTILGEEGKPDTWLGVFSTKKTTMYSSNNQSQDIYTNPVAKLGQGNRAVTPVIKEFAETVAAGGVLWTHMIDGSVVFKLLEQFHDIVTIHDAVLVNPNQAVKVPKVFNAQLYNMNMQYNVMDEILKQLNKVFNQIDDDNTMLHDINIDGELLKAVRKKPDFYNIYHLKDVVRLFRDRIEVSKSRILNDNMVISNIDGNKHSQFDTTYINRLLKEIRAVKNPESNVGKSKINKLNEEIEKAIQKYENVYYSDPLHENSENKTDDLIKRLSKGTLSDKTTRLELLDLLEQRSIPLEKSHKKILQMLLSKVDDSKFQEIITKVFESKQESFGNFDPGTKEVSININIDKPTNGDFNPAEVYVHEIIHAIASHVINNANKYRAGLLIKRLEKLQEIASKHVKIEDFLPPEEEISNYEEAYENAKRRWDYVFKNPDTVGRRGLNEFLAYGLTNKKVADRLKNIGDLTLNKEKKSILQHILDIGNKLIDLFFGTASIKTFNKNVYESLTQTLFDITKANERAITSIGSSNVFIENIFKGVNDARRKGDKKGKEYINKVMTFLDKHTDEEITEEDKDITTVGYVKKLIKILPSIMFSSKYREVLPDLLKSLGFQHTGTVQNVLHEMYESDNLETMVEGMGRLVDNIDQSAQRYRALIANSLTEKFGQLDKTQDKVLAEVGLELDLSSLFPTFNAEEIDTILLDPEKTKNEIDKRLEYLRKTVDKETYNWYVTQSQELANFLNTGIGRESTLTNAGNIAKGYLTGKNLKPSDKTIQIIDELATLYAILDADKKAKQEYTKLSIEGKELFYKTHNQYKKESLENVLENQDIHYIKGYVKYQGDMNVNLKIGKVSQEEEFKKQLYKPVKTIKSNTTEDGEALVFYASNLKATQNYDKGAFSLYSLHNMGANVMDTLNPLGDKTVTAPEVYRKKQKLHNNGRIQIKRKLQGNLSTKESTGFIPLLDLDGNIKDYRLMMHKKDKKEILNHDVSGIRALGNMYATNAVKTTAQEINKNTLDIALADMRENYIPGQSKGYNNKMYVRVHENSHNPKIREYYKLLPEKIKQQIKNTPEKELAVREDLLLQYFGVRDMSILDFKPVDKILPTTVKRTIKFTEEVMKTIVPIYKVSIILKTASVPLGNIMSNINLSIMYDRDPITVYKKYKENLNHLNSYISDERKLLEITQKQKIGEATKEEIDSLPRIKDRLANSPIALLMEKGMYQTIVEDLSQSEIKSNNRLIKKIDEKTEFIPEFIKTGVKYLYIAEGTPVYDFMAKLTQYSDFLGRATEYQLQVEDGVDPNVAAEKAMEMFINYSRPSSELENYVNKMGLWMFTKFGKRIQKVISRGLTEAPVSAALALFFQNAVIETENIGEQQFLLKNWSANWYTPMDVLEGIVVQPHMQFIAETID